MNITITVNGTTHSAEVEPRTLLVHFIREHLRLTGTNIGCDTTSCGACTVHLDGRAVKSCTVLAVQADGSEVTTIEGLAAADGTLHPMQEAFRQHHGLQCGYCTPGMVMAAVGLLEQNPNPTEREVRELFDQQHADTLLGNLLDHRDQAHEHYRRKPERHFVDEQHLRPEPGCRAGAAGGR